MRAEFKKRMSGQGATVDEGAATRASFDMGTPLSLLVALRKTEGGLPGYELGNQGKTLTLALCTPRTDWQYYEASRTLNRIMWAWALGNPDYRASLFKALAEGYTAPENAKAWAKDVSFLQKQEAKSRKKK